MQEEHIAEIISETAAYVRRTLEHDSSGHDWWHIARVVTLAETIAAHEVDSDLLVIRLAALLHDIADWKFHGGDLEAGPRVAREWLIRCPLSPTRIDHICAIIHDISFKGAGTATPMQTREGMIVQDADRLDAIGAIGIARAFAYGGHKGRPLYDPTISPELHATFAQYGTSQGTTFNHFYEKLLLVKDRMNTPMAKTIAAQRHDYMLDFLAHFIAEWDGHDIGTVADPARPAIQ